MGDAQPRGPADLSRAVGDQHDDARAGVRLTLEVLQRLLQPGADVGLGEAAPRIAGLDRRMHHVVMVGGPKHRDRERAEHHHPEPVVAPFGDELREQLARDLALGPALAQRGDVGRVPGRERPVHARASVDQQHHVRTVPDALDLVGGPVQAAGGEHERQDRNHSGGTKGTVEPARQRVRRHEPCPGERNRAGQRPQQGQHRQRKQGERPAVYDVEPEVESAHRRRSTSRHARHRSRRRSRSGSVPGAPRPRP